MPHGRESEGETGEWSGVASTLHTTSEHVSSITTADAHTSAASSRQNWCPPADLNGLLLFSERRNLVFARVPSHFKRSMRCLNVCDLLNPMIRRTGLTKLLKFGSKALLKMLRNVNLSLVRRQRRFWSGLKGLDWLKMVSRCLGSVTGRSSEQQQLHWELWRCLLDTGRCWRETRGYCLARLHCLISVSHLQGPFHRHLYFWTLGMMIHMTCQHMKRCFFYSQNTTSLWFFYYINDMFRP